MEIIKNKDNIPYAIHVKAKDLNKDETKWLVEKDFGIQVAGFSYNKDKIFEPHKHLFRPRTFEYTQEAIIVIKGALLANIYDEHDQLITIFHLEAGDIGIFLYGGHGFKVVEDETIFYEIKNGPFTSKEEDKTYIRIPND